MFAKREISRHPRGFTLPELLVAIAIFLLLASVALINLRSSNQAAELDQAAEDVMSFLREAQSESMAVIDGIPHGVHVDSRPAAAILFAGETYDPLDAKNRTLALPSALTIQANLEAGGEDVIFEPLTGSTHQFGTLTLLSDDVQTPTIITITPEGKISAS